MVGGESRVLGEGWGGGARSRCFWGTMADELGGNCGLELGLASETLGGGER